MLFPYVLVGLQSEGLPSAAARCPRSPTTPSRPAPWIMESSDDEAASPLALPSIVSASPWSAADLSCDRGVRKFSVTGVLTAGEDQWAQVYLGRVDQWIDASAPAATKMVLKLVDPALFGTAMDESNADREALAVDLILSEAKAYAALDGCAVVPQYFGTYEVSSAGFALFVP